MNQGILYPLGYAAADAEQHLVARMQSSSILLVDIRYRPYSRWRPYWNKRNLQARFGECYLHRQQLGNVNYQHPELPIQLLNPEQGIEDLVPLLEAGVSLVLLCACKHYASCHRSLVVALLQKRLPDLEIKPQEMCAEQSSKERATYVNIATQNQ